MLDPTKKDTPCPKAKEKTQKDSCCRLVAKLRVRLFDPMDCGLPGSSAHGILQARILEWVAISFSRGSSQPRNQAQVSCIAGRFFTQSETPGKPTASTLYLNFKIKHILCSSNCYICILIKCSEKKNRVRPKGQDQSLS